MFECNARRAFAVLAGFLAVAHFALGAFLAAVGCTALLEGRCELGLHYLILICGLSTVASTLIPPLLLPNFGVVAAATHVCMRTAPIVQAEHNVYGYIRSAYRDQVIEVSLPLALDLAAASNFTPPSVLLQGGGRRRTRRTRRLAKWYDDDQLSIREPRRCDRDVASRGAAGLAGLVDVYAVFIFSVLFTSGKGPTILEHYWELYTGSGRGSSRHFFLAISQMDVPKSRPGSRSSGSGDLYYSDVARKRRKKMERRHKSRKKTTKTSKTSGQTKTET